ncbi:MAG: hypothetical protein WCC17_07070 [Candidatus Nitrosopolaris sp.]
MTSDEIEPFDWRNRFFGGRRRFFDDMFRGFDQIRADIGNAYHGLLIVLLPYMVDILSS